VTTTPLTGRQITAELDRLHDRRANHLARIDALIARADRMIAADLREALEPAIDELNEARAERQAETERNAR